MKKGKRKICLLYEASTKALKNKLGIEEKDEIIADRIFETHPWENGNKGCWSLKGCLSEEKYVRHFSEIGKRSQMINSVSGIWFIMGDKVLFLLKIDEVMDQYLDLLKN